jgi:hypothetical protein
MKKKIGIKLFRALSDETGQALIIILVLLLLGSLTIVPVLDHLHTALKTGEQYEDKTNMLYTADAGIEDGLWRIKYDFMGTDYHPYDFDTAWPYETDTLNGMVADVTIKNVWLPSNVTLDDLYLSPDDAKDMIESEKLVVVGTSGAIPGKPYHIKIDYTPAIGDNLSIKSLGVWLPQGFAYADNCSLTHDGASVPYYPDSETITDSNGGQSIVWTYNYPYPLFIDFPGVDPEASTMSIDFTFSYTPPAEHPNRLPTAVAWLTTDMYPGSLGYTNPNDVPISWDMDTRIYEITSTAGDTLVQAYSSKCELRQMGDAMGGDYVAIGGSLLADDSPVDNIRETWHTPSSYTLNSIPSDADVIASYLYWAGWRNEASKVSVLTDPCTNMDTYWTYSSPTAWSVNSSQYKAHYSSGGDAARQLTLKTQNLSSYTPDSIIVTWEQGTESAIFSDSCNNLNNWNYGNAWSSGGGRFTGHSTSSDGDPVRLLALKDGMANLDGAGAVDISWTMSKWGTLGSGDGLDIAFYNSALGWSSNVQVFRGPSAPPTSYSYTIPVGYRTSDFKMRFELFGFAGFGGGSRYLYIDDIKIGGSGGLSSSDGLDFAFSGDGGTSWSNYIQAFRGNLGSSMEAFVYSVPGDFVSANFSFKYKLVGCSDTGEKVCIDNFRILNLPIDTEVTFSIDKIGGGTGGYSGNLTAERSYVMLNTMWGSPEGFSYACARDVSSLVKKYPIVAGEVHHTGNATYTVDGVSADLNSNFSFAGWSLIVVYASPSTAGHYIYIRDDNFAFHPGTGGNLDFDEDGLAGGDITNFVVPEPITNHTGNVTETVAAKLTCFVAEGDNFGTSSVTITGQQSGHSKDLSNPNSPATDVWNGKSYPGTYEEGVDIDTFTLLWTDDILTPGDNVLHVDLLSLDDAWNLVYIIISVRSETVTGGTSHYMIYG